MRKPSSLTQQLKKARSKHEQLQKLYQVMKTKGDGKGMRQVQSFLHEQRTLIDQLIKEIEEGRDHA